MKPIKFTTNNAEPTRNRVDAIEARLAKTSEGGWLVGDGSDNLDYHGWDTVVANGRVVASRAVYDYHRPTASDKQTRCDMEFIANAKSDIAWLLAAYKHEREKNQNNGNKRRMEEN